MNARLFAAWFGQCLVLLGLMGYAPQSNAAWLERDVDGNGIPDAWYNPDLNLTYLASTHSRDYYYDPFTQTIKFSDFKLFDQAVAWADSLEAFGFTDWRLPTVGLGCTSAAPCLEGEFPALRELWYAGVPADLIPTEAWFWTPFSNAFDGDRAWAYNMGSGTITRRAEKLWTFVRYEVVRTGDMLPGSPAGVPEPPTLLLLIAGLAGTVIAIRSRRRSRAAPRPR